MLRSYASARALLRRVPLQRGFSGAARARARPRPRAARLPVARTCGARAPASTPLPPPPLHHVASPSAPAPAPASSSLLTVNTMNECLKAVRRGAARALAAPASTAHPTPLSPVRRARAGAIRRARRDCDARAKAPRGAAARREAQVQEADCARSVAPRARASFFQSPRNPPPPHPRRSFATLATRRSCGRSPSLFSGRCCRS